jgi:hypothetical protein
MKRRILQQVIAKLESPKQGNRITWDGEVPGFGVRVTSAGVISFVLEYRIHGRKRRYTIGRYPELTATAARDVVCSPTLIWGTRVLRRFLEDQLDAFYYPLQISDRRLALCRYAARIW